MKSKLIALLIIGSAFAAHAQRAEPAYCDLNNLRKLEVKELSGQLEKLHAYQLGQVLVAGLAVGHSDARDVVTLATHYSKAGKQERFCTWYINSGNDDAKKTFNWKYVSKPTSMSAVNEYMSKLGPVFDQASNNFVKCAENFGYIAMGCDGMKHRGPTLFGMMLAYSGCSAQSANRIVNTMWGTNGISPSVREAVMQKAFELGRSHPEQSAKLKLQFLTN